MLIESIIPQSEYTSTRGSLERGARGGGSDGYLPADHDRTGVWREARVEECQPLHRQDTVVQAPGQFNT